MTLARGILLAAWLSHLVAAAPVAQPQIGGEDLISLSDYSDVDESRTPPSQRSLLPPEDDQPIIALPLSNNNINVNSAQTSSNRPFNPYDSADVKFDTSLVRGLLGSNSSPAGTGRTGAVDSGQPRRLLAAPQTNNFNWAYDFLDRLPQLIQVDTQDQDLDLSPKIAMAIPPTASTQVGGDNGQVNLPAYPGLRDAYTSGMNAKPLRAFSPAPGIGKQPVKLGSIFSGATNANTPQLQSLRSPINALDQQQQQQQEGEAMSETVSSIPPVNNYEAITTPEKDVWTRLAGGGRPFGFGETVTPPLAWLANGAGGRRPPPERELQLSDLEEVLQGIMTDEDDTTSERASPKLSCELTEGGGYCDEEQANLPVAKLVSRYDGTFEVRYPGRGVGRAGAPLMQIDQRVDEQEVVLRPPPNAAGGTGASRGLGYGFGPGRLGAGPRMTTMQNMYS
ncbi:hypothetical protein TWF696_004258 [Orbilia brochopaga]|uniref:Uncharacterized protein n=1 Tax=Orbilia brochopaga TaxID=3140254 RepID=A0AAV9V8R7_9PEZI